MKQKDRTVILPFGETFKEKWDLWKEFKKEQFYFSYKPIGEQSALKDLVEISGGREDLAMRIIDNAIAKGWRGLFPIKLEQNGQQQQSTKESRSIDIREAFARRYGHAQGS